MLATSRRILRVLWFPGLMILALCIGVFIPVPGQWISEGHLFGLPLRRVLIGILFFVFSYNTVLANIGLHRDSIAAFFLILALTSGLMPLITKTMVSVLPVTAPVAIGFLVAASTNPGLATGLTLIKLNEGDVDLAVVLTILLAFSCNLLAPLILTLLLSDNGVRVHVPLGELVQQVIFTIIVPLALGVGGKVFLFRKIRKLPHGIAMLALATLIMTVGADHSATLRELTPRIFLSILVTGLSIQTLMLIISWQILKHTITRRPIHLAAFFMINQKAFSSMIALSLLVAGALPALVKHLPLIVITCILFTTIQLLMNSLSGSILRRKQT